MFKHVHVLVPVLFVACTAACFPQDASCVAQGLTSGAAALERSLLQVKSGHHKSFESDKQEKADAKQLAVAVAVFINDIRSPSFRDALYVLAHSFHKAAARSRHKLTLLALVPDSFPREKETLLLAAGFDQVQMRPIPILPSEVRKEKARKAMERELGWSGNMTYQLAEECMKYWGLTLTSYDRVLVIDADVVFFDPMDELMEITQDFAGTFAIKIDVEASTIPPVQGGFLLFRPNKEDFEAIRELTREADWEGNGWKDSGIGRCYGGAGPDGLLSYYFNQNAVEEAKKRTKKFLPEGLDQPALPGSRMLFVDRDVYDVVVNERLLEEVEASSADHETVLSRIKSAHFTGGCDKPWTCANTGNWMCEGLTAKWWTLRSELEAEMGLPPSKGCEKGKYAPLMLKQGTFWPFNLSSEAAVLTQESDKVSSQATDFVPHQVPSSWYLMR